MNKLLFKSLISTGEVRKGQEYDLNFDHQFIICTNRYFAFITTCSFSEDG